MSRLPATNATASSGHPDRLIAMCERQGEESLRLGNLQGGYEAWQDRALQVIDGKVDVTFSMFLKRYCNDRNDGVGLRSDDPEATFLRYCRELSVSLLPQ